MKQRTIKVNNNELYNFLTSRPGLDLLVKYSNPDDWDGEWAIFKTTVTSHYEDEWLNVQRILKLAGCAVIPGMKNKLENQEYFFSDTFVETFKKTLPFYIRCTFGTKSSDIITKKSGRNAYHRKLLPEFRVSFQHTYDLFKEKRKELYRPIGRQKKLKEI